VKRMLFNATQQEELRSRSSTGQKLVVSISNPASREQRKSNIYIRRTSPDRAQPRSAFVDYGEDARFLPFKEVSRVFQGRHRRRPRTHPGCLRECQELIVQVEKDERRHQRPPPSLLSSACRTLLVLMPNNRAAAACRARRGRGAQRAARHPRSAAAPGGHERHRATAAIAARPRSSTGP